jgi:D-tyrosyl-tRNA(Tyr) deacylase
MRAVIQRVSSASVSIDGENCASIGMGLLVLLGVEHEDTAEDRDWLLRKILNMRIFGDADDKMNRSIQDVNGDIIVVSQFTLHASTKKGNRPSFIRSARPEKAEKDYLEFVELLRQNLKGEVGTGVFGAMMQVQLVNDGPVTIVIDSKNKE